MKSKPKSQQKSKLNPPVVVASGKVEVDQLRKKVTEIVEKHPEKAAKILTEWLRQGAVVGTRKKAG